MRIGIVATTSGGSRRYRCEHRAEALELAGARADVLPYRDHDLDAAAFEYNCFILHRAPLSARIGRLLRAARTAGARVVYDTDDLVFDPTLAELVPWKTKIPLEDRLRKFESRRRAMAACDAVVVSTDSLRAAALEVNSHVAVIPNCVSSAMVEHADAARATRPRSGPPVLAYFSGTASHDIDFLEAADAVADLLDEQPDLRFLVVGPLRLPDRFDRLGAQIDRLERRAFHELPGLIALADVAIAPVERGNPFAQGKSAIKYLEAGLVSVPVVASATSDFVRAIRDGSTGFVVSTRDEWKRRLGDLLADERLRHSIGRQALEDVRARHTTAARAAADAHELVQLLAGIPRRRFSPAILARRLRRRVRRS
jgi:glycosyltransferase involved in cell wall biosynthesis